MFYRPFFRRFPTFPLRTDELRAFCGWVVWVMLMIYDATWWNFCDRIRNHPKLTHMDVFGEDNGIEWAPFYLRLPQKRRSLVRRVSEIICCLFMVSGSLYRRLIEFSIWIITLMQHWITLLFYHVINEVYIC